MQRLGSRRLRSRLQFIVLVRWSCAGDGAFRDALQVGTREQLPQDWAQTQNKLGIALALSAEQSEQQQAGEYLWRWRPTRTPCR